MIGLTDHLINQLAAPDASFWVANTSNQLVPELTRANGVVVEENRENLTFFISDRYAKTFQLNCTPNSKISFLVASVYTLESYQFKGNFINFIPCTPEEVNFQEKYLMGLKSVFKQLQIDGDKFYKSFAIQPSTGYTMSVEEIFIQTPKKGTGEKLALNLL